MTLDPQLADEPNSELLIANIFLGLLTLNEDGSLSAGAASDYVVSDDSLVYSFKLRQDIFWSDGENTVQCTANDFVYGFRRLFLPETSAPRAEEYFCIKNSRAMREGVLPDPSLLGVKAAGDFELEITLEYPNPRFPALLTEPPAMPCCEELFLNAQGKYGLSAECTPSNGAFYVKSWSYDPYTITDNNNLVLRRNSANSEVLGTAPSGLNFFIESGGKEEFVADFLSGVTSCVAVTDEERGLIEGDFGCVSFSNITAGLVFNKTFPLFKNEDFRRALSLLADRDEISSALGGIAAARAVVPGEVSMLDRSYRSLAGEALTPEYDAEEARALYEAALPSLDKDLFAGARIIVPDDTAADAVSYIMQEWQREFGFYCVVETLSESEYRARLSSGDFEIAVVELSGGYNSPAAYLERFGRSASDSPHSPVYADFDKLMTKAGRAADLAESAELYAQAERLIIDKAVFVPIYYKNEYFFVDPEVVGIVYNPFTKTVDFSGACRV